MSNLVGQSLFSNPPFKDVSWFFDAGSSRNQHQSTQKRDAITCQMNAPQAETPTPLPRRKGAEAAEKGGR